MGLRVCVVCVQGKGNAVGHRTPYAMSCGARKYETHPTQRRAGAALQRPRAVGEPPLRRRFLAAAAARVRLHGAPAQGRHGPAEEDGAHAWAAGGSGAAWEGRRGCWGLGAEMVAAVGLLRTPGQGHSRIGLCGRLAWAPACLAGGVLRHIAYLHSSMAQKMEDTETVKGPVQYAAPLPHTATLHHPGPT